jgi:hypothetical protein
MQRGMSVPMIWQIVYQTRTITGSRVTGEVRSYIEISRIFSTIRHQMPAWFLSTNALVRKHSSRTAPFIHVDQSLPTT